MIVLLVQLIFKDLRSEYDTTVDKEKLTITPICTQSNIVIGAIFSIGFLYVFFAVILCWVVSFKQTPSQYDESAHVAACVTFILLYSILIVLVQFLIDSEPTALAFLRACGFMIGAFVSEVAIFVPKLLVILRHQENSKCYDQGPTTRSSMTAPSSSTALWARPVGDSRLDDNGDNNNEKDAASGPGGRGESTEKSKGGGASKERTTTITIKSKTETA